MLRRGLMIGALIASTGPLALATPAVADDLFTTALLQQIQAPRPGQAPTPAPAPQGGVFANITLGQVLGTMSGAVVGKVILEGALNLPQGVGPVIGAVAGYYIWVNYLQNLEGPSATPRKASATGTDGRMVLIGDTLIEVASPLLRPAVLDGR